MSELAGERGEAADPQDGGTTPAPGSMRRKRRRRLFAVAFGLLPFVMLEVGLRLFGVGSANDDVHAGFGIASPLFERNDSEGVYETSLAKQQFFVSQKFAIQKPKSEFRIFCLGGSTVQGRPYRPETSFGKWLELELNAVDSSRHYQAINCGGISYASYRLRRVLQEVLQYDPDLIVLATGHNEFLEDRTYSSVRERSALRRTVESAAMSLKTVQVLRRAVGGGPRVEPTDDTPATSDSVEARLDDEAGYASYHRDEEWHHQVVEQYSNSVDQMLQMCHSASVPVVAVRLGSNLRDCPPFKSEHAHGLSVEDQQRWQTLFDEATKVETNDAAAALSIYEKAERIDDQHPLLHFRIARCYDRLGRFSEAYNSYRAARDADICPLRMTTAMSSEFARLATTHDVAMVDAESLIIANSIDGIPGYLSYIDHVHPTIEAHQTIARAVGDTLRETGLVETKTQLTPSDRREVFREHLDYLGPTYFSNGRRRIGWLEAWARRQRLWDETLPYDTRSFVAAAVRAIDLHDYETADQHLTAAITGDAAAMDALRDASDALVEQGRTTDAKWILERLKTSIK